MKKTDIIETEIQINTCKTNERDRKTNIQNGRKWNQKRARKQHHEIFIQKKWSVSSQYSNECMFSVCENALAKTAVKICLLEGKTLTFVIVVKLETLVCASIILFLILIFRVHWSVTKTE